MKKPMAKKEVKLINGIPETDFIKHDSTRILMSYHDHRGQDTGSLYLVFKNDKIYRYCFVPRKVYEDLLAAKSVGSFFQDHILGKYQFFKEQ